MVDRIKQVGIDATVANVLYLNPGSATEQFLKEQARYLETIATQQQEEHAFLRRTLVKPGEVQKRLSGDEKRTKTFLKKNGYTILP